MTDERGELKERNAEAWRAYAAHARWCQRCARVDAPAPTHRKRCARGAPLYSAAMAARRARRRIT